MTLTRLANFQVTHHDVRVLRRTWRNIKCADDVNGARRNRRLGMFGCWSNDDDGGCPGGHDAFDGLQATTP